MTYVCKLCFAEILDSVLCFDEKGRATCLRCQNQVNEAKKFIKDKEKPAQGADPVNHPAHYQGSGMECIQVIQAFSLGFNLGNAVKYILRADKKGALKQDLQKAVWYLNKEIESL